MYFSPNQMCYTAEHYKIMLTAAAGLVAIIGGTWFMFINVFYVLNQSKSFSECPLLGSAA